MHTSNKLDPFLSLCDEVKKCSFCPRMKNSVRILTLSSGSPEAEIVFIGEAPGRLGADATGVPFHGDKAGDNFESLLDFVGITREEIFVTNAVLCNPKDINGNNATPNTSEISQCSKYLQKQIDIIQPSLVVTLGANALKSTSLIDEHKYNLKDHVRTSNEWYGRHLIPLYHPGQRAMIHRSYANQRSDYQFVSDCLKRLGMKPRKIRGTTRDSVAEVVKTILRIENEVSYFALHKILYLLEWNFLKERGARFTGAFFIRQKDGPYCTDLHLTKLKNSIPELKIRKRGKLLYIGLPEKDLFSHEEKNNVLINADIENFILQKFGDLKGKSNAALKTQAYLTKPMREILRREKKEAMNMYNTPLLIGW